MESEAEQAAENAGNFVCSTDDCCAAVLPFSGLFLFSAGGFAAKKIGNADLQGIVEQISGYIRQAGDILVLLNLKLAEVGILQNVEGFLSTWTEQVIAWMESKVFSFAGILPDIGGSLLDIAIGATAAFYFGQTYIHEDGQGEEWLEVQ